MCPTDEFGIEYDTDVENALKDPKSTVLSKLLDYREKRKKAEFDTIEKLRKEKEEKERSSSSIFPW